MNTPSDMLPSDLVESLVAAFPIFIEHRLDILGVVVDSGLADEIADAVAGLVDSLRMLKTLPPQDQVKSPLELVREATEPIGEALADRQVAAPHRDEWSIAIHPEDVYELYPASSRDLGEHAWQLHLAWGINKARVVAGMVPAAAAVQEEPSRPTLPAVALFGLDRDRREPLVAEVTRRGYRSLVWRNPAALEGASADRPALVLVDLGHPTAHSAIRTLAAAGIRVIAVADRVDGFVTAGTMAVGAQDVVELDRIVDRLDDILDRIV